MDAASTGWAIAGCSAAFFFTVLIIGEVRHQKALRKEVPFTRPAGSMTAAQFEQALVNGRKLVILDDLVLDVDKFID